MIFRWSFEVQVFHEATKRAFIISIPVSQFRVCVLPSSNFLISFRGHMNVESVKAIVFNLIPVSMTLAVVSSQSKETIRLFYTHRQNNREIENVHSTPPENDTKLVALIADEIKFLLLVTPFLTKQCSVTPLRWKGFPFGDKCLNLTIRIRFRQVKLPSGSA